MITGFIIGIAILIAIGWLVATRNNEYETDSGWFIMPGLIVVVGFIAGFVQPFTLERVDNGYTAISVNLTGSDRGVSDYKYETGWVVINTWAEALYQYPTFQQHVEYGDQQVIMKGGFPTTISPTFNYTLIPESVGEMFQALRKDIEYIQNNWLKTAIVGSVQDVSNRWDVDAVFNNREKFEADIVAECNKRIGKWFIVDQLRTNIVPPAALQDAIEKKTQAIQETQAKIQQALVAEAEAKRIIEVARGDSAKAVIEASGRANALLIETEAEAKAIKLKQQEITPTYVDYIRWAKAGSDVPRLPSTMLGSGTSVLLSR